MKNVILVFGSGRSGTSWLAETMARRRGYRLLFEPEHEVHVPGGKVLTDRYLKPGSTNPEVDKFLQKLFRNRIDNDWIAQHSYRKYKVHLIPFLVKKIIVKFVRCNLSMHYMTHRFNVPAVYIRRDPFSTIYSQQRVNFPWLSDLSKFSEQEQLRILVKKISGTDLLNAELNLTQKLALRWCIENILPFHPETNMNSESRIINIDYREIQGNIKAFGELLKRLNLEIPGNLEQQMERPSSKTHPRSVIHGNKPELFTSQEKSQIEEILMQFNYSSISIPQREL